MNVYGQLIKASFEKVSSDLSESFEGLFFYNTTSKLVKFKTNAATKVVVDTDTSQLLSNKEHDVAIMVQQTTPGVNPASGKTKLYLKNDKNLYMLNESGVESLVGNVQTVSTLTNQASTPSTPAAGSIKVYTKTDKNAYMLDDAGIEKPLGSGGSGSSLIWEKLGDTSPTTLFQDGMRLEEFSNSDAQEMYTTVTLPSTFITGTPVKLMSGSFFCPATTGNVLFRCDVSLIRAGLTVLGTYSNNYTSTNVQVAVSATSNQLKNIGDIDITTTSGTINSIAVVAGDKLRIRLYRATASETSAAVDTARLIINAFELKITR